MLVVGYKNTKAKVAGGFVGGEGWGGWMDGSAALSRFLAFSLSLALYLCMP